MSLEHVRVLDFTWAGAGPMVTWLLGSMGAQVAKIEHPKRPDLLRRANRAYGWSEDDDLDGSPAFNELNAAKRSVVVDLTTAEGRSIALRLAAGADVVCENMRPGRIEALGLGYDAVAAVNPSVVYCSLSATGRGTGREDEIPGYAPVFWAEGGGAWLSGWPEAAPVYLRSPVDMHAGAFACAGILAALHGRAHHGGGVYLDCSAIEAVASTLGDALLATELGFPDPGRSGNHLPGFALNDVFPCRGSDQWIAVSVLDADQWAALLAVVGLEPTELPPPTAHDSSDHHGGELWARIAAATGGWAADELEAELQARGIAATRVNSLHQLVHDERLVERGFWYDVDHDVLKSQRLSGLAWSLDPARPTPPDAAPLLDADTDGILAGWLGLEPAEIEALRQSGAVGCASLATAAGRHD